MHLEWLHPSCLALPLSMTCSWAVEPPAPPPLSSSSQPIIPICLHFISLDKSSNGHLIGITHIQNLKFVSCYITSYHLLCCKYWQHPLSNTKPLHNYRAFALRSGGFRACQSSAYRTQLPPTLSSMINQNVQPRHHHMRLISCLIWTCEERLVESKSHISGPTAQ
jgi:hypothetical protein